MAERIVLLTANSPETRVRKSNRGQELFRGHLAWAGCVNTLPAMATVIAHLGLFGSTG